MSFNLLLLVSMIDWTPVMPTGHDVMTSNSIASELETCHLDNKHVILIIQETLLMAVQAAFKRPPPGSNINEVNTIDWDSVKAEDKALLHQVTAILRAMKTDN